MPTTTTSSGAGCVPRMSKRVSTVLSSTRLSARVPWQHERPTTTKSAAHTSSSARSRRVRWLPRDAAGQPVEQRVERRALWSCARRAAPIAPTTAAPSGGDDREDRSGVERELGDHQEGDDGDRTSPSSREARDRSATRRAGRSAPSRTIASAPASRPASSQREPRERGGDRARPGSRARCSPLGRRAWRGGPERRGAVAPTTTTLPLTAAGSNLPCSTSTKLSVRTGPAAPGSRSRPRARRASSLPPVCIRAAAIANVSSLSGLGRHAAGSGRRRRSAIVRVRRAWRRCTRGLRRRRRSRRAVGRDLGRAEHDRRASRDGLDQRVVGVRRRRSAR